MSKPCSLCGKPRNPKFYAFCSATCRDKDLLAWGNDAYILGEDPDLKVSDLLSEEVTQKPLDS